MTTESQQDTPRGVSPLLGSAAAGGVVIAVVALLGWLLADAAGLLGGFVGGTLALVVLFVSTTVVNAVAGIMPGASLLIALLTFFLQVLVLAFVAVALREAAFDRDRFSDGWFAAGVVAVTLGWVATHVWLYTRLRIPAYDLTRWDRPSSDRAGGES